MPSRRAFKKGLTLLLNVRIVAKRPGFYFYTGDWLKDPDLSKCSLQARGCWIDMLSLMHEAGRSGQLTGTVEQLARSCRCTVHELLASVRELQSSGAAMVQQHDNGGYTVTCRRMQRESAIRESARLRKQKQRGRVTCHALSQKSHTDQNAALLARAQALKKVSHESHNASSISLSVCNEFSKENSTHTQRRSAARSAPDGAVCVTAGSKFSLEECRKYAESLPDIRNPGGFAKTIYGSGSDDQAIADFLKGGAVNETDAEHTRRVAEIVAKRIAARQTSDSN